MLEINVKKRLGDVNIQGTFVSESKGVTAVFGQSGAGKTSLINMIAGLIVPDEGVIRFNDKVFFDTSLKINVPVHKRAIGYVFQDARLFPNMTVKKNLLYGSKRQSGRALTRDFGNVCDLLGVSHLLDRMPYNLSGGEKQRVAIGRALLSNPEILLMDEPLASLDRNRRHELLDYISLISSNFEIPIFYVTHSMEEIIKLATDLVVMEKGTVKKIGGAVDILNEMNSSREYGGRDFGVVCQGVVSSYDKNSELAIISFGGGYVEVSAVPVEPGSFVRFKINAIDVVLCASMPPATSVRNIYSGPVEDIIERSNHFTDILINIGIPLWARVSGQSFRDLAIERGKNMYALVKSAVVSAGIIINSPK